MGKKQKVAAAPARQMTKRQISRWERERKFQKIVYAVAGTLGAIIVAVLAFGFYWEFVMPPRAVVAQVNGRSFTMDYYVKLYSLRDYMLSLQQAYVEQSAATAPEESRDLVQQQLQQLQFSRGLLPMQLVEEIIEDELVRQSAREQGITVTPDEVDQYVMNQFIPAPQEGEEVDPEARRAEFEQIYNRILADAGVSDSDYREFSTVVVLRSKIEQGLKDNVPTAGPQAHVQVIVASNEDEARAAKQRLEQGIPFDDVAKEISKDSATPAGGDLGWMPRGLRGGEFDEVVFTLNPGQVSDPIKQSESNYEVVKVLERDEARPIIDEHRQQLEMGAIQGWLDDQKKSAKIERYFDSKKQEWASKQVQKIRAKRGQTTL